MDGPNYVKLSRVFAVQLFSVIIEHYAALPPHLGKKYGMPGAKRPGFCLFSRTEIR